MHFVSVSHSLRGWSGEVYKSENGVTVPTGRKSPFAYNDPEAAKVGALRWAKSIFMPFYDDPGKVVTGADQ